MLAEGASIEAVAVTELNAVAGVSDRRPAIAYAEAWCATGAPWSMTSGLPCKTAAPARWWSPGSTECTSDFTAVAPREARQEAAYAQWFDEVAQRRDGRRERLAEASPFLPMPMWLALGIGAMLTLGYMVAQADRREGVVIQAIPIGFVAALVSAGLLVVVFLDNPYTGGNGGIQPTEMSRTLARIDRGVEAPCDERGNPT